MENKATLVFSRVTYRFSLLSTQRVNMLWFLNINKRVLIKGREGSSLHFDWIANFVTSCLDVRVLAM